MPDWWKQQVKGVPKAEELCTRICDAESRLTHIITKDKNGNYKLYTAVDCKATYTKYKADNPLKLERRL